MPPHRAFRAALSIAVLATGAVHAAPPTTLEAIVRKIQEQQKNTRTLRADFRQEKEMALLAGPEVSTGTFVYARPNNVLWRYDAPRRVEMVIANGILTTYYPDLAKAERVDVKRFEDRIFKYLGSAGAIDDLNRYFELTLTDTKSKPHYVFDLKPRTRTIAKRVQRIQIWIEKTTFLTSKVEYIEGDGDITRYEFTNIRINDPIAESQFALSLPPNVKVERTR